MIPMPLIILPILAAFVLISYQYYRIDPEQRFLNLRFVMMVAAIVMAFGYPIYDFFHPRDRHASWVFLALAIIWLAVAYHLLRRVPPRETD